MGKALGFRGDLFVEATINAIYESSDRARGGSGVPGVEDESGLSRMLVVNARGPWAPVWWMRRSSSGL